MSLRRRKTKENADYVKRIREAESKRARKKKVRVSGGEEGRPLEFTDIGDDDYDPNISQEVLIVGDKGSGKSSFVKSQEFSRREKFIGKNIDKFLKDGFIDDAFDADKDISHIIEVIDNKNGKRYINKKIYNHVMKNGNTQEIEELIELYSKVAEVSLSEIVNLEEVPADEAHSEKHISPITGLYRKDALKHYYLQVTIFLALSFYFYLTGSFLFSVISGFYLVALFVRMRVLDIRIMNGWFGNNASEAEEIIAYIYQNKDDEDFTNGLKLREILYPEKEEEPSAIGVPVGGEASA